MKQLTHVVNIDAQDQLSANQMASFNGPAQPVILEKGDKIYRFCMNQGYCLSEYWFPQKSYDMLFSVYQSELQQGNFVPAQNGRQRFTRILQNSAAVLHHFPGSTRDFLIINFIVKAVIKTEITAYYGTTKTQQIFMAANAADRAMYNSKMNPIKLRDGDSRIKERTMGGLDQIVIPRIGKLSQKKDQRLAEVIDYIVKPF